jgi:HK97 family phage prohead protease
MPTNLNQREYRSMSMMLPVDGEEFRVNGYATTFDDPYVLFEDRNVVVREVISHDVLADADMSDVIMQYDHEGRVFARTSNGTLTIEPDAHGLAVSADLGGTDLGRGLFQEIKGGYITKMSWAFTVADGGDEWISEAAPDGRTLETRLIRRVRKVYDVSAVSLPANDASEISARHLSDGVIARIQEERLKELELRKRKMLMEEKLK